MTGLTESDREMIVRARALGPALRASTGDRDRLAGWLLHELADLAERLGGSEDTRRLAGIRAALAGFDWEHDDRQYALEAIERIAEGGQA